MRKIIATFFTLVVAVLLFPKTALGFGITPAEINVQNLKPGGHYEETIYVTRPANESNQALKVELDPLLTDMESWFTFIPGKAFDFPNGKNTTSFKVVIDVPQNAALKNYAGQITVKGVPEVKASEGVTMISGAVLGVNLTTSNAATYDLHVLSAEAPDVNAGDPVSLTLNIKNSGNTAAAPDRVDLLVMDLFEKPIEKLSDTTLDTIDAFTTKDVKAEFNSNLDKGQYRIDATVYFQGKQIFSKKMVLTVNAKPSAPKEVTQKLTSKNLSTANQVGIALTVIGMVTAVSTLLLYLRKAKVDDADFEKKLTKLMKHNKMLTWSLIIISTLLILLGLSLYVSAKVAQKSTTANQMMEGNIPTTMQEPKGTDKATSSDTQVKGASTEEIPAVVVNKNSGPRTYPVYSQPSFDSQVLYDANNGETFDVIQQSGDWYEVTLQNGASGWLNKTSIKSVNK